MTDMRRTIAGQWFLNKLASGLDTKNDYYGQRQDGTGKGPGFMGAIPTKDGAMTELSVDADGVFMPSVVPELSPDEIKWLTDGGRPTPEILAKAAQHAQQRMREGKGTFKTWREGNTE